ncbi:hypothetical protein HU200_064051 [Digitaria exilis]|uniref:Pentatricopeptide repeat-containing protein n=1 Tax=Digitaria exilis TaxID=1010633 RepID=A0A835DWS4_9POAL|nr:hypothetical protein HU200_064051 [Digitaria exilis]
MRFADEPPPPTSPRQYSGLLGALHHCISGGDAPAAVSLLPTLARVGLRAPFPLLSSLAGLLLLRPAAPSFPSLAGRLLLYVRLAGLKRLVPCSTQLADRLLSLNFLLGRPRDARRLFTKMPRPPEFIPERNVCSWNALLKGYVYHGQPMEALNMFQHLVREGLQPDQSTFVSCLSACAAMHSLKLGEQIHGILLRSGFDQNDMIIASLIDMYSKCSYLACAREVFDLTVRERKGAVLWNSMLSALCHHGHAQDAIGFFVHMIHERQKPDANSFFLVLTACCHCSLVEEGVKFFDLMSERYRIVPGEDHCLCMVDLVSHTSFDDKVVELIKSSLFSFNERFWEVVVRSCIIHGNGGLLKEVEKQLTG